MPDTELKGTADQTLVHETDFDPESGQSAVVTLIDALTTVQDADHDEITPIGTVVDGDSMETLVERYPDSAPQPLQIKATVDGWDVTIRSDGVVRIYDAQATSDSTQSAESTVS
ncbi:HalOD1 output domain-containing protein [Halomicrobium salinisoli]|uniref:HalOD1 output domain-containing protein n=1 Tax=Halomicrobium salinisoli TaxID=2878391 RepID=UPI001CEFDECC|nr:HalOD1 output domain-containing protein [Halomicrobium salinisoli]